MSLQARDAAMQAWAVRMAGEGEDANTELCFRQIQVSVQFFGEEIKVAARLLRPQLGRSQVVALAAPSWISRPVTFRSTGAHVCASDAGRARKVGGQTESRTYGLQPVLTTAPPARPPGSSIPFPAAEREANGSVS